MSFIMESTIDSHRFQGVQKDRSAASPAGKRGGAGIIDLPVGRGSIHAAFQGAKPARLLPSCHKGNVIIGVRAQWCSDHSPSHRGWPMVSANDENMTLKLTLILVCPLRLLSTECGSQAGNTISVPSSTVTTAWSVL